MYAPTLYSPVLPTNRPQILPYDQLLSVLQVSSIRELEDLIIDAIYQDVIRGKLDQKEQQFEVEYTMGRDLEPGKVESLLAALQHWCVPSSPLLNIADRAAQGFDDVRRARDARRQARAAHEAGRRR